MDPPQSRTRVHLAAALASLKERLRVRGVFCYRRARVVWRMVPEAFEADPKTDVDIREATSEDLRLLAAARRSDGSIWRARTANGDVCLVACSGPIFLGYLWISRSRELMTEVNHVLDVSRDAEGVYLFDGYVFREHRRKGVLRALLKTSMRWAHDHGASRLYAAFARENHASEGALRQAGFVRDVGDVSLLLVLGREWKRVRVPGGTPSADVLSVAVSSQPLPRAT